MSLLITFFTIAIYQPFFNLLVFFYWILSLGQAQPDMGIAVIILTIIIRILLLPMSLSGMKSERQRRQIATEIRELTKLHEHDPVGLRQETKKVFKKSDKIVWGELFSLIIQVSIVLMLYRIFKTGLEGKDLHLLYPFMPKVPTPYNLVFLGRFDLSKTSWVLNSIQSALIFVFEMLSAMTSPFEHNRKEIIRLQFTLPVISFFIFMFMPAGKKLFVITTLIFSIFLTIFKYIRRRFLDYAALKEAEAEIGPAEEQLVVQS